MERAHRFKQGLLALTPAIFFQLFPGIKLVVTQQGSPTDSYYLPLCSIFINLAKKIPFERIGFGAALFDIVKNPFELNSPTWMFLASHANCDDEPFHPIIVDLFLWHSHLHFLFSERQSN